MNSCVFVAEKIVMGLNPYLDEEKKIFCSFALNTSTLLTIKNIVLGPNRQY